jgi:hypothetical protein
MKLIPNWRDILTRAWSMWAMALAVMFSAAEAALQLLSPEFLGIPPGIFAALAAFTTTGAMLFRLLAQKGITPDA